jgi:hypothetical protein
LTRAIRFPDAPEYGLTRPYYELALTERELGKIAEARAKIRRAIEIIESDPAFPRASLPQFRELYSCYSFELEDFEEAAKSYQAEADWYALADSRHWTSLLWLAHSQRELKQFAVARKNAELVKQSRFTSKEDRAGAEELLRWIEMESEVG